MAFEVRPRNADVLCESWVLGRLPVGDCNAHQSCGLSRDWVIAAGIRQVCVEGEPKGCAGTRRSSSGSHAAGVHIPFGSVTPEKLQCSATIQISGGSWGGIGEPIIDGGYREPLIQERSEASLMDSTLVTA